MRITARHCDLYRILFVLFFFFNPMGDGVAEIHQWTDQKGRLHFSDTPPADLPSTIKHIPAVTPKPLQEAKTQAGAADDVSIQRLNETAKTMKKLRQQREKSAQKRLQDKRRKRLKEEKRLANIAKKKQACKTARRQQDEAFRQRTQQKNLAGMRKALANYKKKSALRREKCK